MIPILYNENETLFTSNGLGTLSDATQCIITEERNGAYELEMEYVEGGAHFEDIRVSRIIYAKPAQLTNPQPFRIYKITKPLNKRVQIYAQHISYQLIHIPVTPFTAQSASGAVSGLISNAVGTNPFTMQTTVSKIGTFAPEAPASFRNMIGGMQGSILDVYGGELEWDKYTVKLHAARGTNRGLTLRYGKNITDINQEETIEATITGVMPYLKDMNDVTLYLTPKVVESSAASNYPYPRNVVLDMASYVDEKAIRDANPSATEAQIETLLRAAMLTAAQNYITDNNIGIPDVSINVQFVNLGDTEEYQDIKGIFAQAALCDTVTVEFERLGISTTAKIVKTEYNVLLERFESITVGSIRPSLGGTIATIQGQAEEAEKEINGVEDRVLNEVAADIATAITAATEAITGQSGGYVKINSNANGPYELLIMDQPDQTQAVKVWRWNLSGLGFSEHGYSGPYDNAWVTVTDPQSQYYNRTIFNTDIILANTLSGLAIETGTLAADKITTGELTANIIKAGVLQDKANKNSLNMVTGAFSLANGNLQYDGSSAFISLLNNLSLKLNGIPLAGEDITSQIPAAKRYITFSYLKVIKMPYMIYVFLKGYIPALDPGEQQEILDLPTTANTPDNIGVVFGEANLTNSRTFSGIMTKNTNTEATLYANYFNGGNSYYSAAYSYII